MTFIHYNSNIGSVQAVLEFDKTTEDKSESIYEDKFAVFTVQIHLVFQSSCAELRLRSYLLRLIQSHKNSSNFDVMAISLTELLNRSSDPGGTQDMGYSASAKT